MRPDIAGQSDHCRVILLQMLEVRLCQWLNKYGAGLHKAVGSASDCRSKGRKLKSYLSHVTFMDKHHEVISMVIFALLLIQEGQLSVTGNSM